MYMQGVTKCNQLLWPIYINIFSVLKVFEMLLFFTASTHKNLKHKLLFENTVLAPVIHRAAARVHIIVVSKRQPNVQRWNILDTLTPCFTIIERLLNFVTQAFKPGHFLHLHVHPDVAYKLFPVKTWRTLFTKTLATIIYCSR